MKLLSKKYLLFSLLPFLWISCTQQYGDITPANTSFESLVVPEGFDFSSEAESDLTVNFTGFDQYDDVLIEIYNGDPAKQGKRISQLFAPTNQPVDSKLLLPNHLDQVYIQVNYLGTAKVYVIEKRSESKVVIDRNDLMKDKTNARMLSQNLILDGDFESYEVGELSALDNWDEALPGIWYTSTDKNKSANITNFEGDRTLDLKSNGNQIELMAVQVIDVSHLTGDQTVYTSLYAKRTSNDAKFRYSLIVQNSSHETLSENTIYPELDREWRSFSNSIALPEGADHIHVILQAVDINGSNFYVDDITAIGSAEKDTDGDGVSDESDVKPLDPTISQAYYYPAEDEKATVAFEDMWPYKGDYDFNDFVAEYNTTYYLNTAGYVGKVVYDISVLAIGATYRNDFCVNVIDPEHIAEVAMVSEHDIQFNQVSLTGKTEIRVPDIKSLFHTTGYVNTVPGETEYDPISFAIEVTLDGSITYEDMKSDVYLRVDGEIGREVHMIGGEPTSLVNQSLFNTGDDATDVDQQLFYKSQPNFPWALKVPIDWEHPLEGVELTEAYPNFKEFAEGNKSLDWYSNKGNNKNSKKLFKRKKP